MQLHLSVQGLALEKQRQYLRRQRLFLQVQQSSFSNAPLDLARFRALISAGDVSDLFSHGSQVQREVQSTLRAKQSQ